MLTKQQLFILNWGWLINWIITGLAAVVFILAATSAYFFSSNTTLRKEINDRQVFLESAVRFQRAYGDIVKSLQDLALTRSDIDIADLLARQNIALPQKPAPAPAVPPAVTAPKN